MLKIGKEDEKKRGPLPVEEHVHAMARPLSQKDVESLKELYGLYVFDNLAIAHQPKGTQ